MTTGTAGIDGDDRLAPVSPVAVAAEWDALALRGGDPFLTTAWLLPWTRVYAPRATWLGLWRGCELRAGACLVPTRHGLASAANVQTSSWDVVAAGPADAAAMWRRLAGLGYRRLDLRGVPAGDALERARTALQAAGYGLVESLDQADPRLLLPPTWAELLATRSRNLRSQYGRRRRQLERAGDVRLRTTSDPVGLEEDLATLLRLEATGWKARAGTSLLSDPAALELYRSFAVAAAENGSLRLHLLELDGRAIAGDLSVVFAGGMFMLKTAYDESLAASSPGLVLLGDALRAAVGEGCGFYDMGGGLDPYKLRWGATPSTYADITAYRGLSRVALPYRQRLRPALKGLRDRVRALPAALPARRIGGTS